MEQTPWVRARGARATLGAAALLACAVLAAPRPAAAGCTRPGDARSFARSLNRALRCNDQRLRHGPPHLGCREVPAPACAGPLRADLVALAYGPNAQAAARLDLPQMQPQLRCQRQIGRAVARYANRRLRDLVRGRTGDAAAARAMGALARCAVPVATDVGGLVVPAVGPQCSRAVGGQGETVDPSRLRACLRNLAALWVERAAPVPLPLVPNVVVVLTDDQRWDTLDTMPAVGAEVRDKGLLFTNGFVNISNCCPSRASVLTGDYAFHHGVLTNWSPSGGAPAFDPSSTVATWLHDAGYRTGLFGKYLNLYSALSPQIPPGWDVWRAFASGVLQELDRGEYYGYVLSQDGTNVYHASGPAEYSTDLLRDMVLDFIGSSGSGPFFLLFSPYGPHQPAIPADRHAGTFAGLGPWRPPSFAEADLSDKPPGVQSLAALLPALGIDPDDIRRRQLETLLSVDEAVLAIVDALEATGQLARTLIVFTSDNGYLWGEHGIIEKGVPYDESVRVPFVARFDALVAPGRQSDALVQLVDLAPTFAELAGVSPLPETDGRSLVPLLTGAADTVRDELFAELWADAPPIYRMLRSRDWKYVRYEDLDGALLFEELYDMVADPFELENLLVTAAGNPAYRMRADEMHARFPPGSGAGT